MTAFSRLASFSVWLSSVSSLLGKVVMRTNSVPAIAGRALATNWRTSDSLWVWLNFCTSRPPSASLIWMLVTGWELSTLMEALASASLATWSCGLLWSDTKSGVALERLEWNKDNNSSATCQDITYNDEAIWRSQCTINCWIFKVVMNLNMPLFTKCYMIYFFIVTLISAIIKSQRLWFI